MLSQLTRLTSHLPRRWRDCWVLILQETLRIVELFLETCGDQLSNYNYGSTLTANCTNWICSWLSHYLYIVDKTYLPKLLRNVILLPCCNLICPKEDRWSAPEQLSGLWRFSLNRILPPKMARPPTTCTEWQYCYCAVWILVLEITLSAGPTFLINTVLPCIPTVFLMMNSAPRFAIFSVNTLCNVH